MEQMMGIEPISQSWQDRILTIILHLHGISVAISGPARLSLIPYRNIFMLANGTNYGEWCGMTDSNRRPHALLNNVIKPVKPLLLHNLSKSSLL